MTANFSINGQHYDLSEGTMFLITTRDNNIQVRQLKRDLSALQPTNESCEAFVQSDPDVSSLYFSR